MRVVGKIRSLVFDERGGKLEANQNNGAVKMKVISLTRGKVALVDGEDYEGLKLWKWRAHYEGGRYWYAVRSQRGRFIIMHREILGASQTQDVDHKNGDGLDNRRINLRFCNQTQNLGNSTKQRSWYGRPTSSRFKGVSWYPNRRKWYARIQVSRRRFCLGYFETEVEAAKAYDSAAKQHFGEYACLNFVAGDS